MAVDLGSGVHDVYAYGVIAPSTLVELAGGFPPRAGYAEIAAVHGSIGGEAAGSAYVLARLGVRVKLVGTRLGGDGESQRVIDVLTGAGVDCSAIERNAAAPVTEIVASALGDRTVFGTYGRMLADQAWSAPSHEDIAAARMVCLDPFFGEASDSAARWCAEASVPYVTVDCPPDSDIATGAAAVVVSQEYAGRVFGEADPLSVFAEYTSRCRGLVVLTRGSDPILYGRQDSEPRLVDPIAVEARDTTGAGDSFRAGVIYGMLRGYDDERLVRTASALAAMVCRTAPGVLGSPTEDQLERFLDGGR